MLRYIFLISFIFISASEAFSIDVARKKSVREHLINLPPDQQEYFYKNLILKKDKAPRTNDSVPLLRYLDREFYAEVIYGHPAQKFDVSLDTAWSLSWILSYNCSKLPGCASHNLYDPDKSSLYKPDGRSYIASEGDYNLTGIYSYDTIFFAHSNVSNQSFVEMNSVPDSFATEKADGILGLGLKTDDYTPFFYNLLKQKKIKDPIFSIYLNRDKSSPRGGNVILGFIETKHIHVTNKVFDEITYLPIQKGSLWKFTVDKVFVDGWAQSRSPASFCNDSCNAIVDSTTTTIRGPKADVNDIHAKIKSQDTIMGRHIVNCDTIHILPKIKFMLGGKNFTLTGKQYTVQVTQNGSTVCLSSFMADDVTTEGLWVIGGAFLSEYYSIYNIPERKIGFVKAA